MAMVVAETLLMGNLVSPLINEFWSLNCLEIRLSIMIFH